MAPVPAKVGFPSRRAAKSSSVAANLRDRLTSRRATIGVVGLGYVGLPLAVTYAEGGFSTRGFDLASDKVERLNRGSSYIQDVKDSEVRKSVEEGRFEATTDFAGLARADVIFVAVPTPMSAHKDPDTSYIESASWAIAENLRAGQLIVLKSTTYPNTTERLVQPILEEAAAVRGLKLGRDYFLAFSPERIDPGNKLFTTDNTPVVVGGVTASCTELAALALEQVIPNVHRVSNPRVAEMEKLLENIFRSVNIALVNELALLCDRMGGVSIWEVIDAAATKPFGFMPFRPGPGLGGHCIPIDPYYLSWLGREHDFETSFITLAARTNEEMPFHVVQSVVRAIAEQPVRMSDARVLVLGASFKKDVDDTRHSPAVRIMEILSQQGIRTVDYSDPHVDRLTIYHDEGKSVKMSVDLSQDVVQSYNVVVIVTDHAAFPYSMIASSARAIVDTRNALADIPHDEERVYLLGGGS